MFVFSSKEENHMKKEYIIDWQGNDFVKYEGLLDEAHQQGLCRVSTTLVQIPEDENGNVAIVAAEIETSKGTFGGIGDASPQNVGRMIAPHIIRMAETRAKARALRDAVNIGATAIEELGDLDADTAHSSNGIAALHEEGRSYRSDVPKPSPNRPASANQLSTIAKLSRLLGQSEELREDLTSSEASERITELSRKYNELKGNTLTKRSA
jgi:hypothetical protein